MLNSINSYSSIETRKGISGLASGLDTDKLIEGMTSTTRNKILKQMQNKELVSWKMEAYQGLTSKLQTFADKYTSFANSSTNLLSSKFFQNYSISSQGAHSSSITMKGNSDSLKNLSILGVESLATAEQAMTTKDASGKSFSSDVLDMSATGKTVNNLAGTSVYVKYGDKAYAVTFDKGFTGTTTNEVVDAFNKAMEEVDLGGGENLAQKIVMRDLGNGKLALGLQNTGDKNAFGIYTGDSDALKILGFKEGTTQGPNLFGAEKAFNTDEKVKVTSQLVFKDTMAGKSMTFSFNGIDKAITFPEKDDAAWNSIQNVDDLKNYMQGKLDKAFGANRIIVDTQNVSPDRLTGKLTFKTVDANDTADTLSLKAAGDLVAGSDGVFGMDIGSSNRLRLDQPLSEMASQLGMAPNADGKYILKVNDETFEFKEDDTLGEVLNKINNSDAGVNIKYLNTTDHFSITATDTGSQGRVEISDGTDGGNLVAKLFGEDSSYVKTEGKDAVMVVSYDGGKTSQKLIRSTNTFDLDGSSITVNSTFNSTPITDASGNVTGVDGAVTFTATLNTDDMIATIKDMVKDYNDIIDAVNKEMTAKRNREYPPLSKEQEDEMTESQVKDWNEKAKSGMLFGDSSLQALSSELRFAFSFNVTGVGSVSEIGITTSSQYEDNGKIVLNEDKLRAALEQDPDKVRQMFTAEKDPDITSGDNGYESNGGIMTRTKAILDKYASTSGERGIFVNMAGAKDSIVTKDSSLYKQMESIQKNIDKLGDTLKAEETRYYNQFTSLEKYVSQMNAQSSWLTQQFGG